MCPPYMLRLTSDFLLFRYKKITRVYIVKPTIMYNRVTVSIRNAAGVFFERCSGLKSQLLNVLFDDGNVVCTQTSHLRDARAATSLIRFDVSAFENRFAIVAARLIYYFWLFPCKHGASAAVRACKARHRSPCEHLSLEMT